MLAQLIVSGISMGACYALLALGMVLIYKTSDVLNFAQGEMAMVSTFVTYTLLVYLHIPFIFAFVLTIIFSFILGIALEFLFLRRAEDPNVLGLIVMTLGFQMVLFGAAGWIWGGQDKGFPHPISDTKVYNIAGTAVTELNIVIISVTFLLVFLLFAFFRYTKTGVSMKATQQNPIAARLMGIRSKRVMPMTWALSSILGAIAGVLLVPITILRITMMMEPLLKAFAVAVLGGMTSLPGAAVGGIILGVVENLVGGYISIEFKSVVAFLMIILVLCIRPSGLLSRHYVKKV